MVAVVFAVASSLVSPPAIAQQPRCDGNFHIVHDVSDGELNDVTFAPGGDGWAVGFDYENDNGRVSGFTHGPDDRPWVVRFDDKGFEEIHPPHERGTELIGVTALSDEDVWTVGEFLRTYRSGRAIAYHFDGTTWTQMTVSRRGQFAVLLDVVAISPTDIWAVGFYMRSDDEGIETLVAHYDGASWSHVSAPSPGRSSRLNAVDAAAPDNVWAVGAGRRDRPFVLRWDGTEWKRRLGRVHLRGRPEAFAIDVVTHDDIWIVGEGGRDQDLILHRVGRRWHVHDFPDTRGHEQFNGVAATPAQAWAVGDRFVLSPYETSIPLAGYWDGTAWHKSSFEGDRFGHINNVALDETGNAWAVGETFDPESQGGPGEVIEKACAP